MIDAWIHAHPYIAIAAGIVIFIAANVIGFLGAIEAGKADGGI
jgi:hypothetical protein